MKPKGGSKLKKNVEVDGFTVGGKEQGKQGRSHGCKKIVQVAIEIEYPEDDASKGPQIRSGNAVVINDYSTRELSKGIDQMIEKDAVVTTDFWPGYASATADRLHIPIYSEQGDNFVKLHWHIFNIKNWLRGIHHKVSSKHIQSYLDEYHYRFNRRNSIKTCPKKLINRMIDLPWLPYLKVVGA